MKKEYDFSKGVRGKYAKKYKAGTDMERPSSSPNIQIIFVFSSFFLMTLQGAGGFDDESV